MCTELHHTCHYCNKEYFCTASNKMCATINFDKDKNLCDDCRNQMEIDIKKLDMEEFESKWNDLL